jgi:L-lactate dehydrogenase complex protein LldF
MTEYSEFLERAEVKSTDEVHRKKLLRVIGIYDDVVTRMKSTQFHNWEEAREIASQIKASVIDNLAAYLEQFEKNAKSHGIKVIWAEDRDEAQQFLIDLIKTKKAKSVVKSKSMITEELGVNELLEEHKVHVIESDLGELIVQLAGEKPYHIVTPAMHKSKQDVSKLFHEKLGIPLTEDIPELAMAARKHLRESYITADIGITGANFLIAEDGAIVITENEGNARLTMSCPPVHVAFVGIEKVLPNLKSLELFLPLLSTSGTGQRTTCYNSIIRGPKGSAEIDGPEEMYVVLVDNGRTNLYRDPEFREALKCIRCGACLNACPVYKSVGGHTYKTTYQGPIGSVITPHLKGFKDWGHLPFASSLCGACTDVCPVKIPLHHLLLKNRKLMHEKGEVPIVWSLGIKLWSIMVTHPVLLSFSRMIGRGIFPLIKRFLPKRMRGIDLPQKSFSESFREIDR